MSIATMEAERTTQEQRREELKNMEDNSDKLEELQKDEGRWKEKYRRRLKAFTSSIREPQYTSEYLEKLEIQFDDFEQASEFLQETFTEILKVKIKLKQSVTEAERLKAESYREYDHYSKQIHRVKCCMR